VEVLGVLNALVLCLWSFSKSSCSSRGSFGGPGPGRKGEVREGRVVVKARRERRRGRDDVGRMVVRVETIAVCRCFDRLRLWNV
jgi:hypothetical protein